MKSITHQGHFGLENSKKKHARQALFCPTRLTLCNRQPSEPTIKHPVPQEPLTKLTADLF